MGKNSNLTLERPQIVHYAEVELKRANRKPTAAAYCSNCTFRSRGARGKTDIVSNQGSVNDAFANWIPNLKSAKCDPSL